MPGNSELHNIFRGFLDDIPSPVPEHDIVEKLTPDKRPKYKIGTKWEAESTEARSEQDEVASKGAELVAKRDYQDMPPDAIDAVGKPKKKVKITDLDKYEAIERGGEHENLVGTIITHPSIVAKKEETQTRDWEESMDVDPTANPQEEGGMLKNTNAWTEADQDIVQHGDTGPYGIRAQEIGSGQKVPPRSHINQVFVSPLKRVTMCKNDNMDTIEESVEPDKNDSDHSASHKLGKTIPPEPSTDARVLDQLKLNTTEDKGIIDMIEEAVESDLSGRVRTDTQNVGKRVIPMSSTKRIFPSQSELKVNCDFEDDLESNQQDNVRRPKYKSSLPVRKGFVSWWSNTLGKGQISERHTNEVRTIHWWQLKPHYGALHSGVSVEYQWGYGRFEKLWVVQGMPCVLYDEAVNNLEEYPYMRAEYER